WVLMDVSTASLFPAARCARCLFLGELICIYMHKYPFRVAALSRGNVRGTAGGNRGKEERSTRAGALRTRNALSSQPLCGEQHSVHPLPFQRSRSYARAYGSTHHFL